MNKKPGDISGSNKIFVIYTYFFFHFKVLITKHSSLDHCNKVWEFSE